jgi:hypothetical protein
MKRHTAQARWDGVMFLISIAALAACFIAGLVVRQAGGAPWDR